MQKKLVFGLVVLVILAAIAYFAFNQREPENKDSTFIDQQKRLKGPCPGPLKEWGKFHILPNWYACHPAVKDEEVLYQFSNTKEPVVRRVVAVAGDSFILVEDKLHRAWNLKIDGKTVLDGGNTPHFFGKIDVPSMISLQGKEGKGVLKSGTAIIFSDTSPGQLDSGVFGVVDQVDFLGRVESTKADSAKPEARANE